MDAYRIDNSILEEFAKCITWQYDNAKNIIGFVISYTDGEGNVCGGVLKGFFDESTNGFWTNWRLNVIDIDNADDFGLAIWGKLLNCPRVYLANDDELDVGPQTLPSSIYRKLLKAKFKLLGSNATIPDYQEYVQTLFNGHVNISNPGDMSLIFTEGTGLTNIEKAFIRQFYDVAFSFPAGVYDNTDAAGLIFGLADDDGDVPTGIGGFDESTFYWR